MKVLSLSLCALSLLLGAASSQAASSSVAFKRCLNMQLLGAQQAETLLTLGSGVEADRCSLSDDAFIVLQDQLDTYAKRLFRSRDDQACWFLGALSGSLFAYEQQQNACAGGAVPASSCTIDLDLKSLACKAPSTSNDRFAELKLELLNRPNSKACLNTYLKGLRDQLESEACDEP
jgi:hypothetical protein